MAWALCGTTCAINFGRCQAVDKGTRSDHKTLAAITWPKPVHPGALTKAQERTPWLTSWARATFEQGCLSVLPHLEGPCKAFSLRGNTFFRQRIAPDRIGWETLPIAQLGVPHFCGKGNHLVRLRSASVKAATSASTGPHWKSASARFISTAGTSSLDDACTCSIPCF